jgi:hypothetical protein
MKTMSQVVYQKSGRKWSESVYLAFRRFLNKGYLFACLSVKPTYFLVLGATIDVVLIGNRIYWTLTTRNLQVTTTVLRSTVYNSLQHTCNSI